MHVPVLAEPVLDWLGVHEDGTYVDCTAGAGGHAELIARRLRTGRLIAIDRDPLAVALAGERLAPYRATVLHGNYGELKTPLEALGITEVDGVLLDAGVSSMQLDTADRGFSFQKEGPLDMRMDTEGGSTAAELLSGATEDEIARLLRLYGDIRPARRIAAAIRRRALSRGMNTTGDLAEAVREALPFVGGEPSEVRTVFQAVRMAVNDELRHLERGLRAGIDMLAPGGRFVVISFHSGEDRVVKNTMRDAARPAVDRFPDGRTREVLAPRLKILTRKPVTPDAEEVAANPRAHSARLRAAEKLAPAQGRTP